MTTITRRKDGLSLIGHANYGPHGKDIVCAAVSVLVQNLVLSIEQLCTDEIQYVIQPGTVDIKHGTLSANAQLLVESFFIGVQQIANQYPANVRVVQAWKTTE